MAPLFKDYFYPYMLILSDGKPHHIREIKNAIGEYFKLSTIELAEKTKGGKNRHAKWCSWVTTYLKNVNFITSPCKFMYQLTDYGLTNFEKEGTVFSLNSIRTLKEFEEKQKAKKGYWVPSHYTSSGRFVAGYMSQWEWKQRQRRFTKEQLVEYQQNTKNKKNNV